MGLMKDPEGNWQEKNAGAERGKPGEMPAMRRPLREQVPTGVANGGEKYQGKGCRRQDCSLKTQRPFDFALWDFGPRVRAGRLMWRLGAEKLKPLPLYSVEQQTKYEEVILHVKRVRQRMRRDSIFPR